ncbi:MAG TPA: basic amino acid ABC transporter substrate-binding protein [Chloroflexota bacterium]
MNKLHRIPLLVILVVALSLVVSCAQPAATPEPTKPAAAPAPAATAAPAAPAAPTAAPAAKPAATTAPAAAAASGPNIDRVKKAGKLVVLQDATFRPMEFKDEKGDIVGFDVDVADAFAKSLGVKLEVQNINWDGIFVALKQGKGDMILSSVTITDERKKEMSFSQPYFAAGQVIVVPADNTTIKGPNDLKGKVVAVQIDTTGQEAAEKIGGLKEIRKFDGGAETMLAVEQGKVEAGVIDVMVAADFAKSHPKVKLTDKKPFSSEDLGGAFQKDATDLVKAFDDFIAGARKDGSYDKMLQKWGM